MIIWLASYPRSGNLLARTFLFRTLGLTSTDMYVTDSGGRPEFIGSRRDIGAHVPDMPWPKFYSRATASKETFLVKTHDPPMDDQPAIHIVRDGRKACLSYLEFHRQMHPDVGRTLAEIVLGLDHFGSWTNHYRLWQHPGRRARKPRRRLVVRYEELVNGDEALVRTLTEFVGHKGSVQPWVNPFDELKIKMPLLMGSGRIEWEGDPRWTPLINAQFAVVHGPLMQELGYWTAADAKLAKGAVPSDTRELCEAAALMRARLPVW